MSDNIELNELDLLKQQADTLGISYHPSIGVDKLREKVAERMQNASENRTTVAAGAVDNSRKAAYEDAMKLVRIRLTCMDPAKNEWPGEIITVSNDVVGNIKKYIPLREEFYVDGYHVPNIIYKFLRDRKYSAIKTVETPKGPKVTSIQANAYSIEVLPQLTEKELEKLALKQAASKAAD